MRVVSVNVGVPQTVLWNGRAVETGIFKEPVSGSVVVRALNLDGDRQADLSVHGGASKAVYAYPAEHYPFWRGQYPDIDLPFGMFGENLTVEGFDEGSLCIGDALRMGSAEFTVTEPRMPCFKLGIRFGSMDVVKRFTDARRPGFYLSVRREGLVAAGDAIELLERDPRAVPVKDVVRLRFEGKDDFATMRRVLEIPALPEAWREEFRERMASA